MKQSNSILFKATTVVTFINVISLLFSFVQSAVFANYFGTTAEADAYTIATQIPTVFFSVLSLAVTNVIIPAYAKLLHCDGKEKTNEFVSKFLTIIILATSLVVILCECFANEIVFVMSPGLSKESRKLAVKLLRILLPCSIMGKLVGTCTGILQVNNRFVVPAVTHIVTSVCYSCAIVLLHERFGIFAAIIGSLIGAAIQTLCIYIVCRKFYKYRFKWDIKDPEIKSSVRKVFPIFFGVSASELNKVIDKMIASFMVVGSLVAMSYAAKLSSAVSSIFVSGITTVIFSIMANSVAEKDYNTLANTFTTTINFFIILFLPLIFGGCYLSSELVSVVFERGIFDASSVEYTAPLFAAYLVNVFFASIRQVGARLFYSLGDTKTPMINSLYGIAANIVLNFILAYFWGALGLVIATTISTALISALIMKDAKKQVDIIAYKPSAILLLKSLVSAAVMVAVIAGAAYINNSYRLLVTETFITKAVYLALMILLGALVYCVMMLALKAHELKLMFNMVLKRKK